MNIQELERIFKLDRDNDSYTHMSHDGRTIYNYLGNKLEYFQMLQEAQEMGAQVDEVENTFYRCHAFLPSLGYSVSYCEGDFSVAEIGDYKDERAKYLLFLADN